MFTEFSDLSVLSRLDINVTECVSAEFGKKNELIICFGLSDQGPFVASFKQFCNPVCELFLSVKSAIERAEILAGIASRML